MDVAQVVSGNLRRLRTAAGISLADLAATSGVAKTTLHSIEQGQGNPTLSTLWALAAALHVPLGELLDPPAPEVELVRADDERPEVRGDAVGARLLHRFRLRGTVEVYAIDVAPTIQRSAAHLPGVEECLVLTSGRVTTGPEGAPIDLVEGDSIRFDAARPHVYQGHDGQNSAVLLMLHPEG